MRKRYSVSYIAEDDHANPFKFGVPADTITSAMIGCAFWQLDDIREVIEDDDLSGDEKVLKIEEIFSAHRKYEVVEPHEKPLMAIATEASPERPE